MSVVVVAFGFMHDGCCCCDVSSWHHCWHSVRPCVCGAVWARWVHGEQFAVIYGEIEVVLSAADGAETVGGWADHCDRVRWEFVAGLEFVELASACAWWVEKGRRDVALSSEAGAKYPWHFCPIYLFVFVQTLEACDSILD